jgi:hypothetical protein
MSRANSASAAIPAMTKLAASPHSPQHSAEIRQVAELVAVLGCSGVSLRRYDFDSAFFGSFQLEFARGHARACLTWDGRERVMITERATVQSERDSASWQTLQESRLESSEAALAEVQSLALSVLSATL